MFFKKIHLTLFVSLFILLIGLGLFFFVKYGSPETAAAGYCSISSQDYSYEHISEVKFNTGDKTSSGSTYSDYTSSVFTTVKRGEVYNLAVTIWQSNDDNWREYVSVFFDWNQDYDFGDPNEAINLGNCNSNGCIVSQNITIPSGASLGQTRMRVVQQYNAYHSSCGNYRFGEPEDYTIEIAEAGGVPPAASSYNVSGWAWANTPPVGKKEGFGWISFNSTNCDANNDGLSDGTPPGCPPAGTSISKYGVNIEPGGNLTGYAYFDMNDPNTAENELGWVNFDPAGPYPSCSASTCPSGSPDHSARLNITTKKITGWARACNVFQSGCSGALKPDLERGGWDGWILLGPIVKSGHDYGVSIDNSGEFHGWAWGWYVMGWISFNCDNPETGNTCSNSDYKVTTSFTFNQPPTAKISCQVVNCDGPGCQCNGNWVTYNGGNVLYKVNNDSTDPDNNIKTSTWSIVGWQDPWFSCNGTCDITMPKISSGNYTVKLKVEDEKGLSDTTSHPIQVKQDAIAGFMCSLDNTNWQSCESLKPTVGELVYFKDDPSLAEHSSPSEGASSISHRTWEINGSVFDSDNNSNPSFSLTTSSNTVKLIITDNIGRSDSQEHTITATLPLPWWKEIKPF